ncbi:helix-turn-helix domain-containing protein [Microlunatus elymi]|uniref:Helix-turn-helix domain-containing protein n=1 Tax=Microlunatus elymi TaxID=2596828 RepID=A0A516Q2S3_9ACTN|nr:helix-turn-helix domain-containing protein [Microlunatus elymi]QDP97735.1 helix-turn-helix domain-containing protein [Microlunatus elymi]
MTTIDRLSAEFAARQEVLEKSLTIRQASALLGISPQSLRERAARGRSLLALKAGREWRLPAWQFDANCSGGVLPDLGRLSEIFPGGVVALTRWVCRQCEELGGSSPVDVLLAGRSEIVLQLARERRIADQLARGRDIGALSAVLDPRAS